MNTPKTELTKSARPRNKLIAYGVADNADVSTVIGSDRASRLAEAVMADLDCPDVFGHRVELTASIRRHLNPQTKRQCVRCGTLYDRGTYSQHRVDHPRRAPVAASTFHVERRAAIVAAWQGGRTAFDVAREFGISRERVRQILKMAGFDSARHPHGPRVRTCRVCGADYTGPSFTHARAALHALLPSVAPGATDKSRRMAEEFAKGGDAREIAARFGVAPTTVYTAAVRVYGAIRYPKSGRVGAREPRRVQAVSMLRNGDPVWLVIESTGLRKSEVRHLRSRYIEPKATVPA